MTNPGISSLVTHIEGFSLFMVLETPASEIGARDMNSGILMR
jgi:hypothetical protein